ncbi:hypothetical protein NDU88_001850 [Pleurodeles waltl]|uniref:Uncharacterized protein n=1 Tax=Pleurodeles waltl TaxID=8319 RepID=A0AAV7LE04_PLEWA|nr:hypothetical protein NDU88_001850 [Pleurodeles waltl]
MTVAGCRSTAGEDPEGKGVGNPDIRIPGVLRAGLPRQPGGEERKNAEAGERRGEPSHGEQRRSELLTEKEPPTTGKEAQKHKDSATSLAGRGLSRYSPA